MSPAPLPTPLPPVLAGPVPGSGRGRSHGLGRGSGQAAGRSIVALNAAYSASAADASDESHMHHVQQSMPPYTPWLALSQNLGVAAAAAHHADGGVCPVVLAPILAEYIVAEFGSSAQMLLEDSPNIAGILSSSCSQ
jgi:hypothetical protein